MVVDVIGNLDGAVALSRDNHKHVLQVLRQNLVLLVTFEQGVQVVELVFLLVRQLRLQEAHLVHDHCYVVELKRVLLRLDVILRLEALLHLLPIFDF